MTDDTGPGTLYRVRRVSVFLVGVAGFLSLLVLEIAPPANRGLLLALVGGVCVAALLVALLYVLNDGVVFGYAGGYPLVPGVIFGLAALWLSTTDAPSIQLTIAASGGLVGMLAAAGLAVYTTRD